jgi:hypothetical protein
MKGIPLRVLAAYSLYASPKKSLRKTSSNLMRTEKKRHTYSMASGVSMLQLLQRYATSGGSKHLARYYCMVLLPLYMHIGRHDAGSILQYRTFMHILPHQGPWA